MTRLILLTVLLLGLASASVNANACDELRKNPGKAQMLMDNAIALERSNMQVTIKGVTRDGHFSAVTTVLAVASNKEIESPLIMSFDKECGAVRSGYITIDEYVSLIEKPEFSK